MRKPIWWIAAGLVLIGAAVLFFSWRASRTPAAAQSESAPGVSAPVSTAPAVQNPVPAAQAGAAPLPTLEASDPPLHDALAGLMGTKALDEVLKPAMLVRHMVVTIDNLPRKRAAVELRPTKPLAGPFIAKGDEQHSTIDPANYQRYTASVQIVQMLDAKQLAMLYFHFYPLFQQAYQDLGYPNGYFNDRLIETIDDMLATPQVPGEIALVQPNVMYQFADPKLEQLSAGQKLMLRMGPQNAAIIATKLRELRAEISQRARDTDRSRGAASSGAAAGAAAGAKG